jgi:uncharacterized protein DUF4235
MSKRIGQPFVCARSGWGRDLSVFKILFIPVSVTGGLLAGLVGKKLFEQLWGVIDDEEPPNPKHLEAPLPKLVAAQALEGAIFRTTRALFDHETRRAFYRVTGTWPGEPRPEPE